MKIDRSVEPALTDALSTLCRPDLNFVSESKEHWRTQGAAFTPATALRAVSLSDFPRAVVAIRNDAVSWLSRSDSLVKTGFYPPSRGTFTSPSAQQQWLMDVAGDGGANLFASDRSAVIEHAYDVQGDRIAYTKSAVNSEKEV